MTNPAPDEGTMLAAALRYGRAGWRVLPLRGKQPDGRLVAHGVLDATCDPGTLERWWRVEPAAGIGVAVPPGVLVVDVDPRNDGDNTLGELEARHGSLPATLECETGGGGLHVWLRTPHARSTTGLLGPGVDTKAAGGYLVVPPSLHPSGRRYSWRPGTRDIADAPGWLVDLLAERAARTMAEGGVEGERIPDGYRDTSLYSLACALRRRGLDDIEVRAVLALVNDRRCDPPKSPDDLNRITASAMRFPPGPLRREFLGGPA
jgi:hypothetical protein